MYVGSYGYSWSSTASGTNGIYLYFCAAWIDSSFAYPRAYGFQVRSPPHNRRRVHRPNTPAGGSPEMQESPRLGFITFVSSAVDKREEAWWMVLSDKHGAEIHSAPCNGFTRVYASTAKPSCAASAAVATASLGPTIRSWN